MGVPTHRRRDPSPRTPQGVHGRRRVRGRTGDPGRSGRSEGDRTLSGRRPSNRTKTVKRRRRNKGNSRRMWDVADMSFRSDGDSDGDPDSGSDVPAGSTGRPSPSPCPPECPERGSGPADHTTRLPMACVQTRETHLRTRATSPTPFPLRSGPWVKRRYYNPPHTTRGFTQTTQLRDVSNLRDTESKGETIRVRITK